MKVQELMTSEVQTVSQSITIMEAARIMRLLDVGTLPVVENGQLCGIITDRDICCRGLGEGNDPTVTKVGEIMSTEISSCFGDQDIAEAAQLMEERHIRRLAVMNRDNSVAGMLSVDDLARGSHNLAGEVLEAATPLH